MVFRFFVQNYKKSDEERKNETCFFRLPPRNKRNRTFYPPPQPFCDVWLKCESMHFGSCRRSPYRHSAMPNRAVYPIRNGVADAEGYSALLMTPSAFPEGYSAFPEGYSAVVEQPSRNTRRANEVRGEAKRREFCAFTWRDGGKYVFLQSLLLPSLWTANNGKPLI